MEQELIFNDDSIVHSQNWHFLLWKQSIIFINFQFINKFQN